MPKSLKISKGFKGGNPNKCIVCGKACGKFTCCNKHKNDPRCKNQNTGNPSAPQQLCIVCNGPINKQLQSQGSKCCKICLGKNDSRCPTISGGPQQQPQQQPHQPFQQQPFQQQPFKPQPFQPQQPFQQRNNQLGFKSKRDRNGDEQKLRIKGKKIVKNLEKIKKTVKKMTKITKKRNRYSKKYLELLENIEETLKDAYGRISNDDPLHVRNKSKKKKKSKNSSSSSS